MAQTTKSDMLDPQILTEAVQAAFAQKNAFMGSVLVSSGAVMVDGSMPEGGPQAIGKTVSIPYFGTIGEFEENVADGAAATPKKISQTSENATVARDTLAFEVTRWARGNNAVAPQLGDPYEESARQAMEAAERQIDKCITTAFAASPLVLDRYSASSPKYMDYNLVVDGKAKLGDEMKSIVAMVVHSQVEADILKLKDSEGRPLLVQSQREGEVDRFCGIPLLTSDRTPLTGSTMGSVTSSGTTPPAVTLSGTPSGPWELWIDITVGGASDGTAKFKFSTDGGATYSAEMTVPNGGGAIALTDAAVDSLVGNNGASGVTATFANGTYAADNLYKAKANLKCHSLIVQRGAGAFWYNRNALSLQTDRNILTDSDIAAMHLYRAAHLYRRRRGGFRPGVVVLKHNVSSFVGVL